MSETVLTPEPRLWPRVKRVVFTPWFVALVILALVAILDPDQFQSVAGFAARAFGGTLPYILFAVGLLAYLKATGAETLVASAFKGHPVRMITLAALIGGLAPFCSCEVIPFIAALLALGAPLSAVMAFWLASPLVDPPSTLITAAALGWDFAIAKAVAAVGLGLMGGFVMMGLERAGTFQNVLKPRKSSGCGCGPKPLDGKPMWRFWQEDERRASFGEAASDNLIFLGQWLMLAYVLEALMVHYVPANLIASLVGGQGIQPIATAAIIGMPAYLNAYVAPPMLAGLIEQGMSQGAAMAFIMAGAVSSIPAMAAVWSLVKPRVFAAYLSLGVGGAILSGIIFQMVVSAGSV
ncbi:MAG: permease [Pseudomonadota bacterium]